MCLEILHNPYTSEQKVAIIWDSCNCKVAQTEFAKLVVLEPSHYRRRSTFDTASLSSSGLFSLFTTLLLGVRAKSRQRSVHRLSLSLTWTLVLVLLVPLASWWGLWSHTHCHGGSRQSSAPQFLLTACLLRPYPTSRAQVVPKGDCLPVNMQPLHCFHPLVIFLFYLALDLHTFFFPFSQWCCTIVYIVCKKLFTHLIEHCVPLLNWHQTASRQPRQLWILQSLNNSSKAAAQVIWGSACLFLFIPYLHHFTPRLSNMRCSRSSMETSALFSRTDTERGGGFFFIEATILSIWRLDFCTLCYL